MIGLTKYPCWLRAQIELIKIFPRNVTLQDIVEISRPFPIVDFPTFFPSCLILHSFNRASKFTLILNVNGIIGLPSRAKFMNLENSRLAFEYISIILFTIRSMFSHSLAMSFVML